MQIFNAYFYRRHKNMTPKEPDFSHRIVRVTGKVGGDDHQNRRAEAGQQDHEIDLKPQLVVTRLEEGEIGSQSSQSQVQHCVSDVHICDVGYVFLGEGGKQTLLASR